MEVPIKVNVHAWKVRINGLPTRWNISRRGIDIPSILCPLCETGVESSKHLFFKCSVVLELFFGRVCIGWDVVTWSLERLDISWNFFEEGEIPGDGFGNLTKLLHLDISYNNFNGSIPSQLFQLTNLRYLDMGYNYLEGKLGPEVGSFRKLTTLRLDRNRFQGPIPAQLFELESLQELDLANNKLGGGISPEIGRLTNLTFLRLSYNQFTGPIPSSMQNLSKLYYLSLTDNMLAGEIPTSLFKIRTLTGLAIGGKGSKLIE
ncbi:leucine-rich repeat-containing protein [Tanacetum coccineum]